MVSGGNNALEFKWENRQTKAERNVHNKVRRGNQAMEIAIAVSIGLWISVSAFIAYRHVKKEYKNIMGNEDK